MQKCCATCAHFISDGHTVSEVDPSYKTKSYGRYANVIVGRCPLHEFDPEHEFEGVDAMRWGTHVPCADYEAIGV